MRFQAHRGVSTECPENTLEAVRAAVEQGYYSAEIDIEVTKDGQFVLLHDKSINRVARMPDGGAIEKTLNIADLTFEQAIEYDFGAAFSRKFADTKIAFFKDVLEFAERFGIKLKIDNKFENFGAEDKDKLSSLLFEYQCVAEPTYSDVSELKSAAERLPQTHFHYDGEVNEEILKEISSFLPKARITVWLPLENSATAWFKKGFATREKCDMVKRYAQLGIWILSKAEELEAAKKLGADIVETNGQLKPPMNEGVVADMHTHSNHSHDCCEKMADTRAAQERAGTSFAAVTDHSDIGFYKTRDVFDCIYNSSQEVLTLNSRNDSSCRLLMGVEIGEGSFFPDKLRQVEKLCDYDVIIGSMHSQIRKGELEAYSKSDFSKYSDDEIDAYLKNYFADIKKMLEIADFDILAHLTCPLRYITGRYGKMTHIENYNDDIDDILKSIIKKGIALELNTSSLSLALGDFIPDANILKRYRELGGYLITLGSDAHVKEEASANFTAALKHLKALGFENIYYFKKRRPYQCKIK